MFKKRYKNYSVDKADFSMSHFLPYLCHYNENTVITKDGSLIKVVFHPIAKGAKHPGASIFSVKLTKSDLEKLKKLL